MLNWGISSELHLDTKQLQNFYINEDAQLLSSLKCFYEQTWIKYSTTSHFRWPRYTESEFFYAHQQANMRNTLQSSVRCDDRHHQSEISSKLPTKKWRKKGSNATEESSIWWAECHMKNTGKFQFLSSWNWKLSVTFQPYISFAHLILIITINTEGFHK